MRQRRRQCLRTMRIMRAIKPDLTIWREGGQFPLVKALNSAGPVGRGYSSNHLLGSILSEAMQHDRRGKGSVIALMPSMQARLWERNGLSIPCQTNSPVGQILPIEIDSSHNQ